MLHNRSLCLTSFVLVSSWGSLSAAQSQPATANPVPPAAAAPAPAAAPSGSVATDPPVWKQAMTLYELGQVEESLAMLRKQVVACGDAGTAACKDSERAALYMCVGIVLAGGQSNHNGGVQAFKKALTLDETMRVAPDYATAPVQSAFDEARGVAVAPAPVAAAPVQAVPPAAEDDDDDDDDDAPYDPNKKRMWIMAAGGVKYGFISRRYEYYDEDFDDYYETDARGTTQLGGSVAFGGMPGDTSGFTLGARVRSGVLFVGDNVGYIGSHMFLGGTMGPRVDNRFFFIGGGAGFESYFGEDRSALTGHFMASGSMGGFLISGGIDVAVSEYVNYFLFGLEVGYGGLL